MAPRHVHHLQSQAPSEETILSWIGARATDGQGTPVGKVEDVYRVEGRPEWLLIRHHRAHVVAPVRNAVGSAGTVFLPYAHELIEHAPHAEPREPLSPEVVEAAILHYAL
jgi:hypothetical protein